MVRRSSALLLDVFDDLRKDIKKDKRDPERKQDKFSKLFISFSISRTFRPDCLSVVFSSLHRRLCVANRKKEEAPKGGGGVKV